VRAAFVAILTAANLGVTIYDRLPFEGADQNSVYLTIISGTTKSPGLGLRENPGKRELMAQYRLQVDVNADDKKVCSQIADAVEQALMNAIDTLRSTYDIHGLRKILDVDTLALGQSVRMPVLTREARVIMGFMFWTHRQLAT
jgi:hypothetical protein